ncbi:MAG: glucosamine 6-phosphate synthetase [bacterium]
MCGIFGVIAKEQSYKQTTLLNILEKIAKLSQVRGKDSSGVAILNKNNYEISLLRGPVSVDSLLITKEYKKLKYKVLNNNEDHGIFAGFGHARLVTNGSQLEDDNNQPVLVDGIVGIHNGIIVNVDDLWKKHFDLKRKYEIDTEIIYALFRKNLNNNINTIDALNFTNMDLKGTVSTCFYDTDREEFITYTNNGSLYTLTNNKDLFVCSSEKYILTQLMKIFSNVFNNEFVVNHVTTNNGVLLKLRNFEIINFNMSINNSYKCDDFNKIKYKINIINHHTNTKQLSVLIDSKKFNNERPSINKYGLLENNYDKISKIKRCTKCLLPETFPYISFDDKGICNICNNYTPKNQVKPIKDLYNLIEPYRKNNEPDCLIPLSGGRDSSYIIHFVKKELGLNPITFTYDWGMVTDLARRNIARMCGQLGVENIIVSANIHKKREYIRKNILAWLKYPHLGMIPLFMAGDKYFFYYANQIRKQTGLKLQLWGINSLENTDFKVGFAGIKPNFNKKLIYSMKVMDQMKLFGFVAKNLLSSPGYINNSIPDTLGSFFSRYLNAQEDYYHFFDYVKWDEKTIEDTLINEYNWETADDIKSTWRIGDGTASFYNYIYYTVAGFSEFDTFRSNQIREGMLDRETALSLVNSENQPRYESLRWYFEILGLDFESVIKIINNIPKLY